MMKAFCAVIFSLFFLLTTMQTTAFLLLYKLNEKKITEKYCVNKSVPGSCCKGKCHLNKTIAKSENETSKNPFSTTNVKIKEVEIICLQLLHSVIPSSLHITFLPDPSFFSLLKGFGYSLIKPPAVFG
ncbi:MAG: hypothetical protein JWN78_2997 [Bacteroidota bacterium]|nr:hypothetical protein [Bacteroidota bacterium]